MNEPFENPLAKILLLPDFLDAAECRRLVADLDARGGARPVPVVHDAPAPLDPRFTLADLAAPDELIRVVQGSDLAMGLLMKYMAPEALQRVAALGDVGDADPVLGELATQALDAAARDPDLLATLHAWAPLDRAGPGLWSLEHLIARGALGANLGVARALTDDEALAVQWLNIDLLETAVFPGGLAKANRLFVRPLDAAGFAARLGAEPQLCAQLAPAARDWPGLLDAFRGLFADEARCAAALDALLPRVQDALPEPTHLQLARWRGGQDRGASAARGLLHHALHARFPDDVAAPQRHASGAIDALSNAETVDVGPTRARFEDMVRRLGALAAQAYGVRVIPDYSDVAVRRYTPGGTYLTHVDAADPVVRDGQTQWIKSAPRDISVLVYFSEATAFAGGRLTFPGLHVSIAPQPGMAVVFPSDQRYPHRVEDVLRGVRYAVVAWLRCEEGAPLGEPNVVRW